MALENINEPVLRVRFYDLIPFSDESSFRSRCPVCEDGVLLVGRDEETPRELLPFDRCVSCGQRVEYMDVKWMCAYQGRSSMHRYHERGDIGCNTN